MTAVTFTPSIESGITISVTVSSQPVIVIAPSSPVVYLTIPPTALKQPEPSAADTLAGKILITIQIVRKIAISLRFFNFILNPPFLF